MFTLCDPKHQALFVDLRLRLTAEAESFLLRTLRRA